MKQSITIALLLCSIGVFAQKKDTTRYHFTEPDAILIDNLMGQLDQVSGNSDRVSTSQYNQLHRAVLRVDSLIKSQWQKYHPVKEQPKKK
jgi:hypothetical protein